MHRPLIKGWISRKKAYKTWKKAQENLARVKNAQKKKKKEFIVIQKIQGNYVNNLSA